MRALATIVSVEVTDGIGKRYEVVCRYDPGEAPRVGGRPEDCDPGSAPEVHAVRAWLLDDEGLRYRQLGEGELPMTDATLLEAVERELRSEQIEAAADRAAQRED